MKYKFNKLFLVVLSILVLSCSQPTSNDKSVGSKKAHDNSQYKAYKAVIEEEINCAKDCNLHEFYDLLYFSEILDEYNLCRVEIIKGNGCNKKDCVKELTKLNQTVKDILCDDYNNVIYGSKYCKTLLKNWDSYFVCSINDLMTSEETLEINKLMSKLDGMLSERYSKFYSCEYDAELGDKASHLFIRDFFALFDAIRSVSYNIPSDEYVNFFKIVERCIDKNIIQDYDGMFDVVEGQHLSHYISEDLITNANSSFAVNYQNCEHESLLIVNEHAELLEELAERLGEYDEVICSLDNQEDDCVVLDNCVIQNSKVVANTIEEGHEVQYSFEEVSGEANQWSGNETKNIYLTRNDIDAGSTMSFPILWECEDYDYFYSDGLFAVTGSTRTSDGYFYNNVFFDTKTKRVFDLKPSSKLFGDNIANPVYYVDKDKKSVVFTFSGSPTHDVACWYSYNEHQWYTKTISIAELRSMLEKE